MRRLFGSVQLSKLDTSLLLAGTALPLELYSRLALADSGSVTTTSSAASTSDQHHQGG